MVGSAPIGLTLPRIVLATLAEDDRAGHNMPRCLVSLTVPTCSRVVRHFFVDANNNRSAQRSRIIGRAWR